MEGVAMRKIVIIGSGAGGTMVANNLRKELDDTEWQVTIIDRDEQHHFQSGYLFIPFGIYSKEDVLKRKKEFIPSGVDFVVDTVKNAQLRLWSLCLWRTGYSRSMACVITLK
jgi:sulfide:quinone oxidoreductase